MNIYQRMHAVMRELQGIELVKAAGLGFQIIKHDDVTRALRPLYLKHGIVQTASVEQATQLEGGTTELIVEVRWTNIDEPSEFCAISTIGHATSNAKDKATGLMKRDDLGVGKALSYAVKMAQLKCFSLLSGEDDLELDSAKETPRVEVTNDKLEEAMNALAQATTPEQFKVAAEMAAKLSGGLTPEQSKVMGAAWKAARDRTSKPVEQQTQTLPESLSDPPGGLPTGEMQALQIEYSQVRTAEELSAVRAKAGPLAKSMSPAQREIMKRQDESVQKLLTMQREAAQ